MLHKIIVIISSCNFSRPFKQIFCQFQTKGVEEWKEKYTQFLYHQSLSNGGKCMQWALIPSHPFFCALTSVSVVQCTRSCHYSDLAWDTTLEMVSFQLPRVLASAPLLQPKTTDSLWATLDTCSFSALGSTPGLLVVSCYSLENSCGTYYCYFHL